MGGNNNAFMPECHNGKNQKWYWQNGANLKTRWKGHCLDWHTGNQNLFMGGCHWGENLRFWWNIGQVVEIKGGVGSKKGKNWVPSDRKYLSTTWNGGKVDLWKRKGNRQKWEFVEFTKGMYYIYLSGSMMSKKDIDLQNAYLSSNDQGNVDIWKVDDATGRQRWKVKELKDGTFNIMIAG